MNGTAARAQKLLRDRHFTSFLALFAIALIAAAASVFIVDGFQPVTNVDNFIQDWEFSFASHDQPSDPRIAVVAIDENTMAKFPYRSPIDRGLLAEILSRLDASHPRAIGVDVLFDQPTEAAKDAALEHIIRTMKTPLVVAYTEEPRNVTPQQLAYMRAFVPAADRATPDLPKDPYGTVRTVHPGMPVEGGKYMMSFERALAARYGVHTPAKTVPIVWKKPPKGQRYNYFELTAQALNQYPRPVFDAVIGPALFKDKIVLIGSDLTLIDTHRTPLAATSNAGIMPGIIVHAYGLSTLLNNATAPAVGWKTNLMLALALGFIGAVLGILNFHLGPRIAAIGALLGLYWIGGVYVYYYSGIMLGLLSPSFAMIASFIGMDSLSGREARKQRQFIQGAFSRYVSPKVVEALIADPSRMALEGERRTMSYIFTDIADFTTFSENMESKQLALLINDYLEGMTQVVLKHDGMVDKFIGDAVFAIFNAPVDLADHASRAVQCALDMDNFAEEFRKAKNVQGVNFGKTRIGVHAGAAVVGNFGSKSRFNYTAQGDAVNTASRLEGLNKQFGTRLCVSGEVKSASNGHTFREIASVVLKGKTVPTMVWEPLHPESMSSALLERYRAAFAKAAAHAPEAREMFASLLAEAPEDPCIRWHAARLENGETGVEIKMTEK